MLLPRRPPDERSDAADAVVGVELADWTGRLLSGGREVTAGHPANSLRVQIVCDHVVLHSRDIVADQVPGCEVGHLPSAYRRSDAAPKQCPIRPGSSSAGRRGPLRWDCALGPRTPNSVENSAQPAGQTTRCTAWRPDNPLRATCRESSKVMPERAFVASRTTGVTRISPPTAWAATRAATTTVRP